MKHFPLYFYLLLILLQALGDLLLQVRTCGLKSKLRLDWSAWPVVIPFLIAAFLPPLEYAYWGARPEVWQLLAGVALFLGGMLIRYKGMLDLGANFAPAIALPKQKIVREGIYRRVRHPVYLSVILLLLAMPLTLDAKLTWVFSALGILGTLNRLYLEERFLLANIPDYSEYRKETPALIPKLF